MIPLESFTAIDFETMTAERSSACAIGLVKVVSGQIVQKFHSLINPIPDDRDRDNSLVNGITREMAALAPTFMELWPTIKGIIGNDTLVCHNAPFDASVWFGQLLAYDCANPLDFDFVCTLQMTGLSLEEACAKHNIDMGQHHDALDDALACARVYLAETGHFQTTEFKGGISAALAQSAAKKYERATLDPIGDDEVVNKETPFFHARTVITGVFAHYPNRDQLGKQLQALGADMNTCISKKTDIVVIGDGAGPSKLRKIEELQAAGVGIRIIFEPELVSILTGIE